MKIDAGSSFRMQTNGQLDSGKRSSAAPACSEQEGFKTNLLFEQGIASVRHIWETETGH